MIRELACEDVCRFFTLHATVKPLPADSNAPLLAPELGEYSPAPSQLTMLQDPTPSGRPTPRHERTPDSRIAFEDGWYGCFPKLPRLKRKERPSPIMRSLTLYPCPHRPPRPLIVLPVL